jgi:hypothetical protein
MELQSPAWNFCELPAELFISEMVARERKSYHRPPFTGAKIFEWQVSSVVPAKVD